MPAYDFKCASCGELTEVKASISEEIVAPACSHCGGDTRRIWGFQGFKI
jgi:putative FmdB family regulatory protein